ncbi:lysophospholipid acyltransferase family protein [Candidatus Methylopumilus turicensis]|uniref:Lipid A biosynthesis acyltransferase n=1 Tax=Candidatus Methylopumilus turicensis TaxID=1581680 RepID=A0A0B7J0P6_9PROT|nr:lysophospholipid acyltransferase family protein [Candidatus Methylopumilus turicensis]CEN56352.1 Lipid A biosynthesis acyltransferase [Candidatus Methylopumilus turicensis]
MLNHQILAYMLKLLAKLPLWVVHLLGSALGWLSYLSYQKYAHLINTNLKLSQLTKDSVSLKKTLHRNISETGKAFLETFAIWFKDYSRLSPWYQGCTGWEHVESGLSKGKGIIFLTPHLGCFEITSLYYGQFHPITVLFRPPRQSWLMPLINQGRQRGKVSLAPANAQGVKLLLQALKRGEAIGILPDQAPYEGEGEWAPFFGRPAYTMTLASKLAQKSGAQVLMAFGERLPNGRGYHIHIKPIPEGGINTPELLNQAIENTIAQCPSQYMWIYDRYKVRN